MQLFAKFKKIVGRGFRATLNFSEKQMIMIKYNWSFCLILNVDVLDFWEIPGMLVIIKIQLFIVACNQ